MTRFILYLFRWQLSTLILAPSVAFFKHSPSIWGTKEDWIAATISNLIGGCIFFWVDRFIFKSKAIEKWEILHSGKCFDCGKEDRLKRLVIAPGGYDRTDDPNPQYRCSECSLKKLNALKKARKVKMA
jgi:DNA-directed RNA polymerase subunit RPC12/RpoP